MRSGVARLKRLLDHSRGAEAVSACFAHCRPLWTRIEVEPMTVVSAAKLYEVLSGKVTRITIVGSDRKKWLAGFGRR